MIHSIQFLRAIAAIMVVLFHISAKTNQYNAGSIDWLVIGNAGVDLFFIISGFIMCYTTYNKSINFISFIKARIQRIIPLYWIFTTIALAIYLATPQLVNSSANSTDILSSFLLLPTKGEYLVLTGWTLRYEFYFYLVFSLVLIFNDKKYWKIAILLAIIPLFGIFLDKNQVWIRFLFDTLIIEFSFGILAYYLFTIKLKESLAFVLILTGICLLILFQYKSFDLSRFLAYGLPMFFVFLGSIHLEKLISTNNLSTKLIELLGNSSYSLYITHIFVLKPVSIICSKIGITNTFIFASILLITSIIFGIFTYKYIETPLNNYFKKSKK